MSDNTKILPVESNRKSWTSRKRRVIFTQHEIKAGCRCIMFEVHICVCLTQIRNFYICLERDSEHLPWLSNSAE